jgi:hypothetical protein
MVRGGGLPYVLPFEKGPHIKEDGHWIALNTIIIIIIYYGDGDPRLPTRFPEGPTYVNNKRKPENPAILWTF